MSEKSKFGAIFILLVVFAIGSLCGIGSTIFYLRQAHDHPHRTPRDIYRVQVDRMTSRLERFLELTEDQVPLVRQEIAKFGEAMKELNQSMEPEFRAPHGRAGYRYRAASHRGATACLPRKSKAASDEGKSPTRERAGRPKAERVETEVER